MSRSASARRREGNEIEFSRIVAFSDGVFAIAITLLVLNLDVPAHLAHGDLGQALLDQRQDLYAFALSFAVIGRFWLLHHRFFGDVVGFDGRLLAFNLFYLAWIVLIPFSSKVLGDYGDQTDAVVLYAVNLASVTLTGLLMSADARRADLAKGDPAEERAGNRRAAFAAGIFLASIPVAFLSPQAATYTWIGLLLLPQLRRAGST
jgi:TMEM175 potassium channel family protein